MGKHYRYYLGRITKGGVLETKDLINAVMNPAIISKNLYHYTFTNMHYNKEKNYIYGKLVKYTLESEIETVLPEQHKESSVYVAHKKESSSPFIIILDYMGIVYPHVWNNLLKEQFEKYFSELITEKHENFFVSCMIEPIVDLRTFVDRVSTLSRIEKINATVVPPNPLFGPVWEELKDYLNDRDTKELTVIEKSNHLDGIKTKVKKLMAYFLNEDLATNNGIEFLKKQQYDMTDAAILMAADGYGRATLEGYNGNEKVIIKTKDNQKSFLYDKDPEEEDFYYFVLEEFKSINHERYLGH